MRRSDFHRIQITILSLSSLAAVAAGCVEGYPDTPDINEAASAVTLAEGFESGTKTAYAPGAVTLDTGAWIFDDALIGNLSTDVKTGTQSARIRNSGKVSMGFDRTTGAGTVTIHHASFSADASGTWGLFASQDQ